MFNNIQDINKLNVSNIKVAANFKVVLMNF